MKLYLALFLISLSILVASGDPPNQAPEGGKRGGEPPKAPEEGKRDGEPPKAPEEREIKKEETESRLRELLNKIIDKEVKGKEVRIVNEGDSKAKRGSAAYYDAGGCAAWYGSEWGYRCVDNSYCVHTSMLCNGGNNCLDGSDEVDCKVYIDCSGCLAWYGDYWAYRCRDSSYCVNRDMVCDGGTNCLDGSDEYGC